MASYWFRSLHTGEKIFANTVQEISRLAQREANKFGQAVQIMTGDSGRKSHRKMSMAKNPFSTPRTSATFEENPDPMMLADHMHFTRKYATKPNARASAAKRPYIVRATKGGKTVTVKVGTMREAREVAEAYAANGYRAAVGTNNPTSPNTADTTPKKYRGQYPNRIESVGGIYKAYQEELGGRYQARTNSGKLYTVFPVNGRLPKLGSEIADWPAKHYTGQSSKRI